MVKIKPVIKWTGSKRKQSEDIISRVPKEINTYYEPFVGGGSVMFQLLHSDINVKNIMCSDLNKDLIELWNMIKDNPQHLINEYSKMWKEINSLDVTNDRLAYYNQVRKRYNGIHNVIDFYFLSRTSANGLIRYNSKGEFNAPYHKGRKGINPDSLLTIINDWSEKLNKSNVRFVCQSYDCINTEENDFIYIDPPYVNVKDVYFKDEFNYNLLWEWLSKQKGNYALSFDGTLGSTDNTYNVPENLYNKHIYLQNGISGFKKIHSEVEYGNESLYLKIN